MIFEWDEDKRKRVIKQHGIDFEDAVDIFDGLVVETLSSECRYKDKPRLLAVGVLRGTEISVFYRRHEDRHGIITARIITARRASKHEQQNYYKYLHNYGVAEGLP